MISALTKYETDLTEWLHRSILIAPCTVVGELDELDLSEESMGAVDIERANGVYAELGPTWDADIEVLCEVYGEIGCSEIREKDPLEWMPMSYKNLAHWD